MGQNHHQHQHKKHNGIIHSAHVPIVGQTQVTLTFGHFDDDLRDFIGKTNDIAMAIIVQNKRYAEKTNEMLAKLIDLLSRPQPATQSAPPNESSTEATGGRTGEQ